MSSARERGWALSEGRLQVGATGLATAIAADASIGVVTLGFLDLETVAPVLVAAADTARAALAG